MKRSLVLILKLILVLILILRVKSTICKTAKSYHKKFDVANPLPWYGSMVGYFWNISAEKNKNLWSDLLVLA